MSRIVQKRRPRQATYHERRPRSPWSKAFWRAAQLVLLVGLVAFLFASPYLERAHHLRAISRLDPDAWGPHLSVLCSLDQGQRQLKAHFEASPEVRRARLLPLLKEHSCPERVYASAIGDPDP